MSNQKRFCYLACSVLVPIFLLFFVFTVLAAPSATTYTVCASGCDFSSIQTAINAAISGDTINLSGETFTEPFYVDGKSLTIQGAGAENTIIQAANAPGVASDRVIEIYAAAKVTLTGVTVRNGVAPDPGGGAASIGGGIYNVGELTLTHSIVTNNDADYGGGIFNSKSPDYPASKGLFVLDSTIASNHAATFGGGIYNFAGSANVQNTTIHDNQGGNGGGIHSKSEYGRARSNVTIVNSTITGNYAGAYGGGIDNNSYSTMRIDGSTIEDNSANTGGGIYNYSIIHVENSTIFSNTGRALAGGLYNNQGTSAITNTTITQNHSSLLGGGISNWWNMTIVNCTITGNSTGEDYGGGIYNTGYLLELSNSILADNYPSEADCEDYDGTLVDLGYNLVKDGSCIADPTSLIDDPKLGPLQDNGGETQTHALLDDSPAIDAIPISACAVTKDQRGIIRPQSNGCDIGAFERILSEDIYLPFIVR
jgi:hypothetical protein